MIWENVQELFIIEKKGRDALIELLEKSGHSEIIKDIIDERRSFMFSIGKGVYFIRLMRNVEDAEIYIGITNDEFGLKSYDGIPVNIIILLIFPLKKEEFVRFVSYFFRLLNIPSVRKEILKSKNVDDVRSALKKEPI